MQNANAKLLIFWKNMWTPKGLRGQSGHSGTNKNGWIRLYASIS